jgi:hypothetical protein
MLESGKQPRNAYWTRNGHTVGLTLAHSIDNAVRSGNQQRSKLSTTAAAQVDARLPVHLLMSSSLFRAFSKHFPWQLDT